MVLTPDGVGPKTPSSFIYLMMSEWVLHIKRNLSRTFSSLVQPVVRYEWRWTIGEKTYESKVFQCLIDLRPTPRHLLQGCLNSSVVGTST